MKPRNSLLATRKPEPERPPATTDAATSALLGAARQIFIANGLQGLTVRSVAERAGCTTMQVYSRFRGKDGLLQALFDEGFDTLTKAQRGVPRSLPPVERVRQLCREYLRIAAEFPHHYSLMLGKHSGEFSPPMESQQKALATLDHLVEAVGSALPASANKPEHAREVAQQILAFCHGWAMLSTIPLVEGSRSSAIDRAVFALLGANTPIAQDA